MPTALPVNQPAQETSSPAFPFRSPTHSGRASLGASSTPQKKNELGSIDPIFRGRHLAALPVENAEECLPVGSVAAFGEELFGLHRGNLLRSRNHQELVHARAVALADRLQRRLE